MEKEHADILYKLDLLSRWFVDINISYDENASTDTLTAQYNEYFKKAEEYGKFIETLTYLFVVYEHIFDVPGIHAMFVNEINQNKGLNVSVHNTLEHYQDTIEKKLREENLEDVENKGLKMCYDIYFILKAGTIPPSDVYMSRTQIYDIIA